MIKEFSARILNICKVVTRVHRPCFIMWHTGGVWSGVNDWGKGRVGGNGRVGMDEG